MDLGLREGMFGYKLIINSCDACLAFLMLLQEFIIQSLIWIVGPIGCPCLVQFDYWCL
jgi:hypothetical protein